MKTDYKDYYQILGVSESANEEQIKKAYRKLAIETHPDRNPNNPESEDRFKEITEAYGVLMDPVKRKEYDFFRGNFSKGSQRNRNFNYSQQEIFENMFRQGFGRDAFKDLNVEFTRSGFRSGTGFFETILFSGAAGTLGKLLRKVPGPIGKLGTGIWILQSIGASIYAYKKSKSGNDFSKNSDNSSGIPNSIKNIFQKSKSENGGLSLDINFDITIPSSEANSGAKKQISYKVGEQTEKLLIKVPPGIETGGKLRVKEKGNSKNGKRGDLILTVNIQN